MGLLGSCRPNPSGSKQKILFYPCLIDRGDYTGNAIKVEAHEDARLILVAGKPLNEPIVQYGPFVMNTAEEIQQTLRDYKDGYFQRVTVKSL